MVSVFFSFSIFEHWPSFSLHLAFFFSFFLLSIGYLCLLPLFLAVNDPVVAFQLTSSCFLTDDRRKVEVEGEEVPGLNELDSGGESGDDQDIRQDGGDNRSSNTEGIYRRCVF